MILQCITVRHMTALLVSSYHSDSQHDKNLLTAHIHFCFLPADSVTLDTVYEYNQTHLHRADSNSRCFLCVRTEENLHRSLHLIQDTLQHCVYRSIQKIHLKTLQLIALLYDHFKIKYFNNSPVESANDFDFHVSSVQ